MTMTVGTNPSSLKLLARREYAAPQKLDPLPLYYWPILGTMYRRRVELCLAECTGGARILEVGFGSGVTFVNLHDLYQEIHGLDRDAPVEEVARGFRGRGIPTSLQQGDVCAMPYPDGYFDTVLLISILEHLTPEQLSSACREIARVLRPGGQMVYGVPIERPLMVWMFRLLGSNIREQHFSTHSDVAQAAGVVLKPIRIVSMSSVPSLFGPVYQVGHFIKAAA
jgi:SAM-dependent methyltransferase